MKSEPVSTSRGLLRTCSLDRLLVAQPLISVLDQVEQLPSGMLSQSTTKNAVHGAIGSRPRIGSDAGHRAMVSRVASSTIILRGRPTRFNVRPSAGTIGTVRVACKCRLAVATGVGILPTSPHANGTHDRNTGEPRSNRIAGRPADRLPGRLHRPARLWRIVLPLFPLCRSPSRSCRH